MADAGIIDKLAAIVYTALGDAAWGPSRQDQGGMVAKRQAEQRGETPLTPAQEVERMLAARFALLWVVTGEEMRVERSIAAEARRAGWTVRYWDSASGAQGIDLKPVLADGKPIKRLPDVIAAVQGRKQAEVWILRDADAYLRQAGTGIEATRAIKTLARELAYEARTYRPSGASEDALLLGAVIILTSSPEIPESLRPSATVFEWPLPDREQIELAISQSVAAGRGRIEGDLRSVVEAAAGLPMTDVEDGVALALAKTGAVGSRQIALYKRRVVEKGGLLQWHEPDPRGLDAVGGLGRLKRWFLERREALSPEARAYGLAPPRGVLLAGVPGCGKSLMQKAIAAAWGVPLLRLDLGALKGRYVGQSEERIRQALRTAEAVAPIILGLEEIEKALGGATGGGGDSGVSQDQLGFLLTWLQEHEGAVFLVATANDCTSLPPELLRKGRFDEAFFVDLPQEREREEVLAATIRRSRRDPDLFDLEEAAGLSEGFSGAELASAWDDRAMLWAFNDGKREPVQDDLLRGIASITPTAANQGRLELYRQWGREHAIPASDVKAPGEIMAEAPVRRLA